MTSDHILTVREAMPCTFFATPLQHQPIKGPQVLSCAGISDITAFRLPSAEHSWCVLEFACREVHESSGDWILYFATNAELERFISALEVLWDYQNEEVSFCCACCAVENYSQTSSLYIKVHIILKFLRNGDF